MTKSSEIARLSFIFDLDCVEYPWLLEIIFILQNTLANLLSVMCKA